MKQKPFSIFILLAFLGLMASISIMSFEDEGSKSAVEQPALQAYHQAPEKQPRTFLVGYSYKHTWGRQVQGTIRVTTVYYATDGQEFLMAVIRDLKEAGIVPADEYFDNPKKASLTLLSIDPIPADFVATTEDPLFNPKQEPDEDTGDTPEPLPKKPPKGGGG